jgi:AraC-like DNA-binding protein
MLRKTEIAVTHIKCDRANNGLTAPIPREDAFLVTLQLRDCPKHELWLDDRAAPAGPLRPGAVSIYDLRRNPIVHSVSPFHSLHFYLPRSAINAISDMEGCARTDEFDNDPGIGVQDEIVHGLGQSLLPSFDTPAEATPLFIDQVTLAAAAHVLYRYGRRRSSARQFESALAPWQEQRAKDIISARLDGYVTVSYLAQQCGLSVREFSYAFKKSVGMAPHRWLEQHRIEKAKDILRHHPRLALSDVASACGFSGESHLRRAFLRITGMAPGLRRSE